MSYTIESISKHSLTKWYLYILRSICKQSKPRCRQITTPTPPHHSIFTSQTLFLMPNQQYQSTERQWNKKRKTRRNNSNHWPRLHEAQTTTVDNVFALWPHRQQCSADRPTATRNYTATHTHTHSKHPFNGPFSGTTRVSRYQKGKINVDFTEARDSEWQWHQLGHMQVCTSLQTDNHANTSAISFLQTGCPSCRPTNSVKALKA